MNFGLVDSFKCNKDLWKEYPWAGNIASSESVAKDIVKWLHKPGNRTRINKLLTDKDIAYFDSLEGNTEEQESFLNQRIIEQRNDVENWEIKWTFEKC